MKSGRILYWDMGKSSFVNKDLEIFRNEFIVHDFTFKASKNLLLLFQFAKQFFVSLYYVFSCKVVICQFSGYHSLIPFVIFKIFGKKRLIIAGGTDCVAFPSIRYGNFQKKYLKWFTKKSFQLASVISPVDETLIKYSYSYQNNDYPEQGYRVYVKELDAIDKVIYNGYDSDKFYITSVERAEKSFLTVAANLNTKFGPKLKGIDLIMEMAIKYPDCIFTVIGGNNMHMENKPENLNMIGNVNNSKLLEIYNRNRFYMQLSMSEGFPNALCEAMLCGCIPIVSDVGAMKKIVGTEGYVLTKKDSLMLSQLISEALKRTTLFENQVCVRNNIEKIYTLERRKVELTALLNTL